MMSNTDKLAVRAFVEFLSSVGIDAPEGSAEGKSTRSVVAGLFHKFDDSTLRAIVQQALRHRDSQQSSGASDDGLLGVWGDIIDDVKEVIAERRDLAGTNFQQLIATGMQGDQRAVDRVIITLVKNLHIDYLFLGILEETLQACKQSQAHEDQVYMLTYFQQTIARLIERSAAYAKKASPSPATSSVAAAAAAAPTPSVAPVVPAAEKASDANPAIPKPATSSSTASTTERDKNDPVFQQLLISAGEFVNQCIKDASGDAKLVQTSLQSFVHTSRLANDDERITALLIAIEDNHAACEQAGYTNKAKLLKFMQTTVEAALTLPVHAEMDSEAIAQGNYHYNFNPSTYHAPKFVDHLPGTSSLSSLSAGESGESAVLPPTPISAEEVCTLMAQYANQSRNNKKFKKTVQKQINSLYRDLVGQISQQLTAHHWAVVDHFSTRDLIRRVRLEAHLFKDSYETSEIWVGKAADVGAHLSVPNIRGDKVLWLCGGKQLLRPADSDDAKPSKNVLKVSKASGQSLDASMDTKASSGEQKEGKEVGGRPNSTNDLGVNPLREDSGREGEEETTDPGGDESAVKLYEPDSMRTPRPAPQADSQSDSAEPHSTPFANHSAPEGLSRQIRTHGEIEPCKLQVKAKAPLRRFSALKELIMMMDTLVAQLRSVNPALKGLYERSDAMLAVYPGDGSRFANHVDNTTNDGRRLTVLCYLNPGWEESLGGALRITEPASKRVDWEGLKAQEDEATKSAAGSGRVQKVDVLPSAGRLAMFFSSEIPHEVMPTFSHRYALTIWYYDRAERQQAMADAQAAGKVHKMSQYSVDHQLEAKEFIAKLLKNHDRPHEGGEEWPREGYEEEPTEEELAALANTVQNELSAEALEIVASITGAPSTQSFRQGFPLLTTKDLQHMRALFRRMGLQN